MSNIITLYHGNDHVLVKPLFGFGKSDNDYGSGFYTTLDKQKAAEWAVSNGSDAAYVNIYEIDTEDLNVIHLDDYGILTWISEIVYNRGARGEDAIILGKKITDQYKIDMSNADIIIGYRADDSYSDIVDAFLQNKLNIEEVERLFKKGDLGQQYFIKSELAFNKIKFCGFEQVNPKDFVNYSEVNARIEVSKFLKQRNNQILLNHFQPSGITAVKAANEYYEYDSTYQYYFASERDISQNKEEEDLDEI